MTGYSGVTGAVERFLDTYLAGVEAHVDAAFRAGWDEGWSLGYDAGREAVLADERVREFEATFVGRDSTVCDVCYDEGKEEDSTACTTCGGREYNSCG